jgi:hypothetical protein
MRRPCPFPALSLPSWLQMDLVAGGIAVNRFHYLA